MPNSGGNAPQMPEPQPMPQTPPMDNSMMPDANGGNGMGDIPQEDNGEQNQFDSNFDPGVEADENQDPERFIQQLTGKLSTSLGSFIKDNGEAPEDLCKYVAKMIVKQAVKGLDEEGKDSIIKAINTSDTSDDENADDSGETGDELPDDMPMDNGNDMPQDDMQQPINEWVFTKRGLRLINENFKPEDFDERQQNLDTNKHKKRNKNRAFTPKKFNRL